MSDIHKPFNDDELRSLLNMGPFTLLMRENMPVFVSRWQATLDAERARAAELQRRLDAQPYESESELVRLLAAREAEVREAREALGAVGVELSLSSSLGRARRCYGDIAMPILARTPGGNEALRTLLERAAIDALKAVDGDAPCQATEPGTGCLSRDRDEIRACMDRDEAAFANAIVARLLGQTGDGAQKGDSDA